MDTEQHTRVHVHMNRLEAYEYILAYRTGVGRVMTYTLVDDSYDAHHSGGFRGPSGGWAERYF